MENMKRDIKTMVLTVIWSALLVAVLGFQVKLIFRPAPISEKTAYKPGQKVPDFTLSSLDGQAYHFEELVKTKPVLILFFSSSSNPSRLQIGGIDKHLKEEKDPRFQAILISEDSRSDLESMKKDLGVTSPILLDADGVVTAKYGITAVPSVFLVGKDGKLIYATVGDEGFSVFKIQGKLSDNGAKIEIEERPEAPKPEEKGQ
jgi:peroxiredoxin